MKAREWYLDYAAWAPAGRKIAYGPEEKRITDNYIHVREVLPDHITISLATAKILIDKCRWTDDEGPFDEGWQSPELSVAWDEMEAAVSSHAKGRE